MHFTEGQLRQYERIMQEKPGYDRRSINTQKERDCKHCLYFDQRSRKCSKKRCTLFDN
ncbi:MAG: hypothetical protein KGZ96_10660 [Clostridia bacterium]|jgi:hypothetical protein|nr:hypothetical protein [Clostridia bacterium]